MVSAVWRYYICYKKNIFYPEIAVLVSDSVQGNKRIYAVAAKVVSPVGFYLLVNFLKFLVIVFRFLLCLGKLN